MSPKTVMILSPQKRRDIIQENILKLDYEALAGLCHCTERTIKRDVQQWKREGGFEEFLIIEFLKSYPTIKATFPEKAFDRLCYLLGKTMTQKREIKEDINIKQREEYAITITKNLSEYDAAIEEEFNRILKANRSRQPMDSPDT